MLELSFISFACVFVCACSGANSSSFFFSFSALSIFCSSFSRLQAISIHLFLEYEPPCCVSCHSFAILYSASSACLLIQVSIFSFLAFPFLNSRVFSLSMYLSAIFSILTASFFSFISAFPALSSLLP